MKDIKILLLLFYLLLILSFSHSFADIIAEVDGKPITLQEIQNKYELLWKDWVRNKTKYPEISEETLHENLKKIALEQEIKERLFQIYAEENGIRITNYELKTIFKEIYSDNERFLSNGKFDEQKFLNFRNQHYQTYQKIINKIRNDILDEKITKIIKEQFQLSDQALFSVYYKKNAKIKLKYIIIPDSLMPDMFPATPVYFNEFHQKNMKKILFRQNIFWFFTRNSQKDSLDVWKDYIKDGIETYFDSFAKDYYEKNIENQNIFKVDISYILFNKNDIDFDIEISADSIKNYYEKNIEEFVTVRDTLPIKKVWSEIYETLYENKKKTLTDSLILDIIQKARNNNFSDSIPKSKITENIEFIKNVPYYEYPFSMLSDTIFATSKDSVFIKKKGKNIVIGRVNEVEKIPTSQLKNIENLIEKRSRKKWDEDLESRFQKYYQSQKDRYFSKEKFKFQYLYFHANMNSQENILDTASASAFGKIDTFFYLNVLEICNSINSIQDSVFKKYLDSLKETDYIMIDSDLVLIDSLFWLDKSAIELIKNSQIGEKIPKIFKTENGYVVLFLADKILNTDEETIALAKKEFSQIIKYEQCRIFTEFFIDLLKKGDRTLLPIFGGLIETDWLAYSDTISDFENSEIILRDAFLHNKGTYSHSIRLSKYGFGVYYVADKKEVDIKQFQSNMDEFREDYYEKKFNKWLKNYKKAKRVKIFKEREKQETENRKMQKM